MTLTIIPSTISHAYELARTLREQDRLELTCFGSDPRKAMRYNYRNGIMNKTALIDGKVAAMWGVGGTVLGYTGKPWLLTSDIAERDPFLFVRVYREELDKMLQMYDRLENFVLAAYHQSVRLLEVVGFILDEPKPFGENNVLYRRFWLEG